VHAAAVLLACFLTALPLAGHAEACQRVSPADAEAVVSKAVSLIEELGVRAALPRLMHPQSEYRKGELYVFVLDSRGVIRGSAMFGQSVGADVTEVRDPSGRYFVKEMLRVAKRRGRGWVAYEWVDPCTGRLAEKQTYVTKAGDFVVAAGIYSAIRL
jgi:cytochrome c